MILKLIPLLLVILLMYCSDLTYNPSVKNMVDVEQPKIQNPFIYVEGSTDTLKIWGNAEVFYSLKNVNYNEHNFKELKIFVDDKYDRSSNSRSCFNIYSKSYSDGLHKLRLELYVRSNSGSLADKLEAEYIVIKREIPLIIDNSEPEPISISTIGPVSGTLRVTWPKYQGNNFQEYQIYLNDHLVDTIYEQDHNLHNNKKFMGNYGWSPLKYRVDIKAGNYYKKGPIKTYQDTDKKKIVSISLDEQKYTHLTWQKCKYYSNFNAYKIQTDLNSEYLEEIASINNVQDTSYVLTDPIRFGSEVNFRIFYNGSGENNGVFSDTQSVSIGEKMPYFRDLRYVPVLESIYIKDDRRNLLRLNQNDMQVAATSESYYHFDFADDGSKMYASNRKSEFYRIDPLSLECLQTLNTSEIVGFESKVHNLFFLPPSKLIYVGFIYVSPENYTDKTYLIDIESGQLLDKIYEYCFFNRKENCKAIELKHRSQDGKYVALQNDTLYSIETGKFIAIRGFEGKRFFQFLPSNNYVTVDDNHFSIIDINNGSTIFDFYTQNYPYRAMIDPTSDCLGGEEGGDTYRIYDLNDGTLKKEIPLTSGGGNSVFYFANSTIYSGNGLYMRLDLK